MPLQAYKETEEGQSDIFISTVSGKNNPGIVTVSEECCTGKGSYPWTRMSVAFGHSFLLKKFTVQVKEGNAVNITG